MPAATCDCRGHGVRSEGKKATSLFLKNKKFKASVVNHLKCTGELPKGSRSLCDLCAAFGDQEMKKTQETKTQETNTYVDSIINALESDSIPESEIIKLAHYLGKSQQMKIYDDIHNISDIYKNIDVLKEFDINTYLQQRNPVLRSFIEGCSNARALDSNHKRTIAIAMAIDNVYKARSLPLITPLAFSTNLLQYYSSGSKSVVNMCKYLAPSASYTTTLNWINNQTQDPLVLNEQADIVTYFDKNQVLCGNYRVNLDSKAHLSVITTVLHIIANPTTTLQRNIALCPSVWLNRISGDALLNKYNEYLDVNDGIFSKYRDAFITSLIETVHKVEILKSKDVMTSNASPYDWVDHHHMNKPSLVMGEQVHVNPCSYESVRRVLGDIRDAVKADRQNKWTVVGCDGLPYLLAARMIEQDDSLKDILLLPGMGHYEINMVRALFRLLWVPLLSFVAKMLGFRSLRALTCCQLCTNHHKAWQIVDICFHALTHELMYPYVLKCHSDSILPSLQGYYAFLAGATDDNYIFMANVVFTYIFSLQLFRAAMRRNNHDALMAARNKFSILFYGLNKTMYQDIDFRDNRLRLTAPDEIKKYIAEHETFTVSGHTSKGEGGDFILESKNRATKRLLPPGVPEEKDWVRVCRTVDKVDELRQNISHQLHMPEADDNYVYHRDLTTEIHALQKSIRERAYLSTPYTSRPHTGIDGTVLDTDLKDFVQHCKDNKRQFISQAAHGRKCKLAPIFITVSDRAGYLNVENKTKDEIECLIMQGMKQIKDLGRPDESEELMTQWSKDKVGATKAMYINFHDFVMMAVEDAENRNCDSEDDADDG